MDEHVWRSTNVRMPPEMLRRIDELVDRMNLKNRDDVTATRLTRSHGIRAAIVKGIEALDAELPPLPPRDPTTRT